MISFFGSWSLASCAGGFPLAYSMGNKGFMPRRSPNRCCTAWITWAGAFGRKTSTYIVVDALPERPGARVCPWRRCRPCRWTSRHAEHPLVPPWRRCERVGHDGNQQVGRGTSLRGTARGHNGRRLGIGPARIPEADRVPPFPFRGFPMRPGRRAGYYSGTGLGKAAVLGWIACRERRERERRTSCGFGGTVILFAGTQESGTSATPRMGLWLRRDG